MWNVMGYRMRKLICALVCVVWFSEFVMAAEAPRYRLLLQVSEESLDLLNLSLNNAKHAQESFGPDNIEIEIVVYGGGVNTLKYYMPTLLAEKVKQSIYSGVRIVVCEHSLRAAHLRASDMLPDVRYIPSGITELVEKQTQGWSYVRP